MKVIELISFLNEKISSGQLRPESSVVIGDGECGGIYEYSPDKFHLVCMKGDENSKFFREEIDASVAYFQSECPRGLNQDGYYAKQYKLAKETQDKVNGGEWSDAIVL